jgi:hypothetical protein
MRRVLVLRSGLGPAARHSRASVAALLDLSVRRVARIERRGIRRLRRLDRTTGCVASAAPGVKTILASTGLAATFASAPAAARGGSAREGSPAASPPSDGGGVLGAAAGRTPSTAVVPIAVPESADLNLVVIVLALVAAVVAGGVAVRRQLR